MGTIKTGDGETISGEVPFPEAHLSFINGTEISLRPAHTSHTVMGVHYELEVRHPDGSVALLGLTLDTHGQGDEQKSYIVLEAKRGLPLFVQGERYGHTFQGAHPSFHPPSYRINGLSSKGYKLETDGNLGKVTLYCEQPKK